MHKVDVSEKWTEAVDERVEQLIEAPPYPWLALRDVFLVLAHRYHRAGGGDECW